MFLSSLSCLPYASNYSDCWKKICNDAEINFKVRTFDKVKYSKVLFILMFVINYEAILWDGDKFDAAYPL